MGIADYKNQQGGMAARAEARGTKRERARRQHEPGFAPSDYEPGDHTAAQVAGHIAEHPRELEAVLHRERKGRKRKGLLKELEQLLSAQQTDEQE